MRITCPNCNAQYEVGDELIPADGRDVQCSNCGTTWFQEGRARDVTAVEERAVRRPTREVPEPEEAEDEPAPVYRRREPDQETLDILREERAREDRLRAGDEESEEPAPDEEEIAVAPATEAPEDETPEEAPADPVAERRARAAAERARMAEAAQRGRRSQKAAVPRTEDDDLEMSEAIAATLRDASDPDDARTGDDDRPAEELTPEERAVRAAAATGAVRSTRRELLPDIEEINSSLRPDERQAEAEAEAAAEAVAPQIAKRSSGFRIGFLVVCAAVLLAVGAYVFAEAIATAVPAVAGLLDGYSDWVDAQRVALAAAAEALTEKIAPDT
ncbi:zinc-ribbon domain-containing protein [Jannaschia marina]|uniref:zinc-ribbon domain-containing protein n=1 Tax=Jannaschia marina TaxID=2741674 RepID=UPI0015CDE170|nr:zinc-ribbon domain-containing protein [Jannaschia marina]